MRLWNYLLFVWDQPLFSLLICYMELHPAQHLVGPRVLLQENQPQVPPAQIHWCDWLPIVKKPLNIWPAPVSWPSAGSCAFIQVLRSEPCHRFADVVPRLTPFSPFNLTYLEYLVRLGLHSAVFRQTQRQWWHSTIPSLAVSQADHMQETPGRVAAWQLKSAAMTPSGKKISRKTDCNCSNNIQMFLLFPHPWICFTWCIYRDILIMAFTLRW